MSLCAPALLVLVGQAYAQLAPRPIINTPLPGDAGSNLPVRKIGLDDLLGVAVYDAPELTRTVRVEPDGQIRLPLLKQRIPASGLAPAEVEKAIADTLRAERIMVDPVVSVVIVESRSRPVNVVGAVRKPLSFQLTGGMTLIDAIARAEGLSADAGPEIIVSRGVDSSAGAKAAGGIRIRVDILFSGADPTLNLRLEGGEVIAVPAAAKMYIVGTVKRPGAYPIRDGSEASVLRILALAEGLLPFASKTAYVYRGSHEIPVELEKILKRRTADFALLANDVLYVPDRSGRRGLARALEVLGGGIGGAALLTTSR